MLSRQKDCHHFHAMFKLAGILLKSNGEKSETCWIPKLESLSLSFCVCACVQVKLWRLCDPELQPPSSPELTLRPGQGRLELVLFHPTSSGLLAVGATKVPLIWDAGRQDTPLAGICSGETRAALSWVCCLCLKQSVTHYTPCPSVFNI